MRFESLSIASTRMAAELTRRYTILPDHSLRTLVECGPVEPRRLGMMAPRFNREDHEGGRYVKRFLIHWLVIALALWVTAYVLPGVNIDSTQALAIAAIVLGLVNALIRPFLTILTLPITILTLGLFYLVVNGLTFLLAAKLVPGFHVAGFWWAVLGALGVSIVSSFVGMFTGED